MPTEKPPTWESDEKKAESMAYAEEAKRNDVKRSENMAHAEEAFRKTLPEKNSLSDTEKQFIETASNKEGEKAGKEYDEKAKTEKESADEVRKKAKQINDISRAKSMANAEDTFRSKLSISSLDDKVTLNTLSNKVGEEAGKKYDIENMAYEDEDKRNDVKRSENMAHAEEAFRKTLPTKNLTPEQIKSLKNVAEEAGKEYDTEKRQSLQGVDDQYLPQYEEMALRDMKKDFAKKVIEAETADRMIDLSKSVMKTQENIDEYNDEYKKKYNKDAKKLTPLEWVRYQQYKRAERKKLDFINKGVPQNVIEKAFQENLNIASNALKNKESQIIHLGGAIKNEAIGNEPDFDSVLKIAPQLEELQKEKVILEKEFEKAGGKIEKAGNEEGKIKKASETAQETKEKSSSDKAAESKPGKATKRELPGWIKILLEGLTGVALMALGGLFSIFEKQVGKKKGK